MIATHHRIALGATAHVASSIAEQFKPLKGQPP